MVLPTPEDKRCAASPDFVLMSTFMAVALYNVIELHFLLFTTFKRKWHGLYFWSMLASTWGVGLHTVATVFEVWEFAATKEQLAPILVFLAVGWYLMVTGQALVLYSRLHLLPINWRIIRGVLIMIIANCVVLHAVGTTSVYLVRFGPPDQPVYMKFYMTFELIQLTLFSVQELILSSLYIFPTIRILRDSQRLRGSSARKTLWYLIYFNILIIAMDASLLGLQYAGFDKIQHFYKPAVYSVKLKLEFAILNRLVETVQSSRDMSYVTEEAQTTTREGSLWVTRLTSNEPKSNSTRSNRNNINNNNNARKSEDASALVTGNDYGGNNDNDIHLSIVRTGATATTQQSSWEGSRDEIDTVDPSIPRSHSPSCSQSPFAPSADRGRHL